MEDNLANFGDNYFYLAAAVLSCLAYLLRSMLWLRILVAAAAILSIVAGITLGITSLIGWNTAFLVINLFHIVLLLLDRAAINLPEDTREIYQRFFSSLSTREFRELITKNGFANYQDENIISEFEVPDRLFIVLRGGVNIVKDGQTIATLRAGDFIGEMSFLSKEPASASAFAENFVHCAYWTHADLENLKLENLTAHDKFIAIIGRDLVRKLRQTNERRTDSTNKLDFVI